MAMIVTAPVSRAAITAASPTLPAPKTAIDELGRGFSSSSTAPAPVVIEQPT
jgi:hypothetical protein